MLDNLLTATNASRTSLSNAKKKLSKLRIQIDDLSADLEKMDTKFENILAQAEIYKAKLEREMGREVRRLQKELALLRNSPEGAMTPAKATESDLKVASTIAIFDSLLRHMCGTSEDFRLASEAFLFPAIYERVMEGKEEAYFLEEIPPSALTVIARGKEYIDWVRTEFNTHLTYPEAWNAAITPITDWWRNDALPLLYGARDEQWDIDMALSLTEMLLWKENVSERPINFPKIFDAYEIYRKYRNEVYQSTGLNELEVKLFSYGNE
jgi:hypothetical protein